MDLITSHTTAPIFPSSLPYICLISTLYYILQVPHSVPVFYNRYVIENGTDAWILRREVNNTWKRTASLPETKGGKKNNKNLAISWWTIRIILCLQLQLIRKDNTRNLQNAFSVAKRHLHPNNQPKRCRGKPAHSTVTDLKILK